MSGHNLKTLRQLCTAFSSSHVSGSPSFFFASSLADADSPLAKGSIIKLDFHPKKISGERLEIKNPFHVPILRRYYAFMELRCRP